MPPPPPDMPRVPLATFNNFTDECARSEWRRKMTVCARSYNGVTTDGMDVGSAVGVGLAVGLSIMAVLLAASSMFVWVTLLGMSTAWVVLILAPCLALCRLDLGFALISFMSGIHRQPPGCARYTLLEEGRAGDVT